MRCSSVNGAYSKAKNFIGKVICRNDALSFTFLQEFSVTSAVSKARALCSTLFFMVI
jgi:hypothetical protein